MATEIDRLQIKIEADSAQASSGIESLVSSLEKLKNGSGGLTKTLNSLNKLTVSLNGLKSASAGLNSLNQIAAGISAIGSIGKPAGLNSAMNTLKKVPDALNGLATADLSGLNRLHAIATALKGLGEVKGLSGFTSAISALKKLPEVVASLKPELIQEAAVKFRELAQAMTPLALRMGQIGQGFQNFPRRVQQATTATVRFGSASAGAGQSVNALSLNMASLVTAAQGVYGHMQTAAQHIASWITNVNDYVENVNLFTVSMGSYADQAMDYAEKVNSLMGVDISEWIRNQGIFMSIATGFGLAEEKAYAMSKGLTELSYDISSFFNISLDAVGDGAFAKVQSGISGELEPLRRLGYALDEATLQELAYQKGIDMKIGTMTQAQKAMLRYTAIAEQSARMGVIGDLSRTLITPANAIRILKQQVQQLARALGSLFIPILITVIPYIQAFTIVVTAAVRALAAFLGFKMPKIDYSGVNKGVGGVADSADTATDALGGAAKAAKKLKDQAMGFDELNVLAPETPDSGKDDAGGYGGDLGLDPMEIWDDNLLKSIQSNVDALIPKVKEMLKWVGLVGGAFAAWKIAKGLYSGLVGLRKLTQTISGLSTLLFRPNVLGPQTAAVALLAAKIKSIAGVLTSGIFAKGLGAAIMGAGEGSLGAAVTAIGVTVGAIALLAAGLIDVVKNSELFQSGVGTIIEFVGWLGDRIGWVLDKIPGFEGGLGGISSKISELTDGLFSLGDIAVTVGGFLLFGPVGLAIEGVIFGIKGIGWAFGKDVIPQVELFGKGISDATKTKVEPFLKAMGTLDNRIKTLDWSNVKITVGDVKDVKDQLAGIVDTITTELDSDRNEALATLEPLAAAFGKERYAELQKSVNASYETMKTDVLAGETRINEIMAAAAKENRALTDEEAKEIETIQRGMKETGIKYLSESETESNLILTRLKDNATKLSAEQAASIIQDAKTARDETVTAAQEQYNNVLLEAQRMLDTGTINKTQYDEIVKAATTTKDETVKAADTQYSEIVKTARSKMGEYAKYIDEKTGELKSRWKLFLEDMGKWWSELWTNVKKTATEGWTKLTGWFSENVGPKLTKAYWAEKFNGVRQGIASKLEEVKTSIAGKWNDIGAWFKNNVAPKFTKDFWAQKFDGLRTGFLDVIRGLVNGAASQLNKLIDWINDKLNISFEGLKNPLGGWIIKPMVVQLGRIPHIPTFAQGGFPDVGSLFVANEAGPELVGSIGGRTAVASQDQIVRGVADGVYEAVVAALSQFSGSENQEINVYLDGRQITASVEKVQRERGRQLLAGGLI